MVFMTDEVNEFMEENESVISKSVKLDLNNDIYVATLPNNNQQGFSFETDAKLWLASQMMNMEVVK